MTKLTSRSTPSAFWATLPHRFWQWAIPRPAYGRIVATLSLLLLLGLTTVQDYGVSWDEGTEVAMVKYNVEWLTQQKTIPRDLKHYGLVFNGASELLYQAKQWLAEPRTYSPRAELTLNEGDRGVAQALRRRLQLKHVLTFLWTLMAYGGAIMLVALLAVEQNAWFAAVVLALMPRFWAHSFFNPKDIPFASVFTLVTACGALLIQYDHHCRARSQDTSKSQSSPSQNSQLRWRWPLGFGILMGLLTGVRIGGWVVLVFFGLAHLLTGGVEIWRRPRRLLGFYGSIFLGWAFTTIAVYPSSWQNPIVWFWETNRYLSSHPWASEVLFQGSYWPASELPWFYIPQWVGMTVPLIWLLAAVLGLLLLGRYYSQFTVGQRAAVVLVLCQGLGLPLAAIATNASVYGGLRQFLFVLPAIAILAAYALLWLHQQLANSWQRLAAVSALVVCLSPIVTDMVQLHPHQYAYFNRASGGITVAAGQYDVDYWGLSLREGVDWLNAVAEEDTTLAIGGPQYIGEMFARSDVAVLDLETTLGYGTIAQPDYYVSMVYLDLPDLFPNCPVVHEVERQGVPLSIVRDCTRVVFEPAEPISQTASGD